MAKNGEKLKISKEWFVEHYVNKRLSAKICARLLGCHENTVLRWLKRYEIEARYQASGELNPMWGRKGKKHHNYNSEEKVCPICGEVFSVPMYDIERRRTCSWDCRNELWKRTEKQAGENNPNWLGGIDYRRGKGWRVARKLARERDAYKCVKCGISEDELGRELDVHHIIPYKEFEDDGKANRLDNLASLCRPCHVAEDRAYASNEAQK